jgi:chromosome segregation ATPase
MELQDKLRQAQETIASFNAKWKYQNQAITSAKQALHKLEQELGQGWQMEKQSLLDQLEQERQKNSEMHLLLEQKSKRKKSNGPNLNFFSAFQASHNREIIKWFIIIIKIIICRYVEYSLYLPSLWVSYQL